VPPLSVQITGDEESYLLVGDRWRELPADSYRDVAEAAIWQSGWVSRAAEVGFVRLLHLKLRVYHGTTLGLLEPLTLFVVPARTEQRFEVALDLLEQGRSLRCSRSADTSTWYQLLLVFAYPFRSPDRLRNQTVEALALQCLAELLEKREAAAAP